MMQMCTLEYEVVDLRYGGYDIKELFRKLRAFTKTLTLSTWLNLE